jgi:hypothetical protein
MSALQYALSQSIGIYYKNYRWKDDMFYKIKDYYTMDFIEYIGNSRYEAKILLKDGTTIKFVDANTDSRGSCFSKIILEPEIDDEVIRARILPTLKHQNRNVMIISEDEIKTL